MTLKEMNEAYRLYKATKDKEKLDALRLASIQVKD